MKVFALIALSFMFLVVSILFAIFVGNNDWSEREDGNFDWQEKSL